MYPLSVVIITFNEEHNIGRCIRSVKEVADEIIVVDSFSTDGTVQIAKDLGATVYQEKFRGYIGQKNFAMKMAKHNYVLSLDADEMLDRTLVQSILDAKKSFHHRAYSMNRCTNYCGHFIRHGLWYPDRKVRLFDRTIATWGGVNPHDRIELQEAVKPLHLAGDILHYSFNSVEDLVWQNNRLSSIAASSLHALGQRSSWYKRVVRPTWAFINGYFLRKGFLDGADGFAIAVQTAHGVFLKYSKLHRLEIATKKKVGSTVVKPMLTEQKTGSCEN